MSFLALVLVAAQLMTIAGCAVQLSRRPRQDADTLPRSLRRIAPVLFVACVVPLFALLGADVSVVFWGLWGIGYLTAGLVYLAADTPNVPRARSAPPEGSTR